MPETLDETYERILRGINKAQKEDARRLLQCLTVAARPLRVEELAELLAFDFQTTKERGIPTLKEDWRWNDQEAAILSTCSSLIAIVRDGDLQVVQFSHFSVKEYLTSPRLARSPGDVSRFHINLNAAHTILAQACLGTLLQLGDDTDNSGSNGFPLVEYAARHWVEHAQFENVSSRVRDGMVDLFDNSKPHFSAWLRVHDIDKRWDLFAAVVRDGVGSPLYYAAFCGFYDLVERLIMEHPEQVNAHGGRNLSPLPAALSNRHFHVANLLCEHGAVVDVRDMTNWTPLHVAALSGSVDIMQWLLNHGADASAETDAHRTPLHMVARATNLEAVQLLLEHDIDVNSRDILGETPLHDVLACASLSEEGKAVETVRRLLERGADQNIRDDEHSTPLHQAASSGWLEAARLLLSYGAKVNETDGDGWTPFQVALSGGFHEFTELLLEHGAVPPP
jgi:ankyrin repeat protein